MNRKVIVLLTVFIASGGAFAMSSDDDQNQGQNQGQKKVERQWAGGAEDLLGITKFPESMEKTQNGKQRISLNCTNANGRIIADTDPEYDHCMSQVAKGAKSKAGGGS